MRHWVFFTIAAVASLAVFLRVWSTAPAYEKRKRVHAELKLVANDYTMARREVFNIIRAADDPPDAIDAYFARRPPDLVERTGADVSMLAVAGEMLFGRGRVDEAMAMWARVADTYPRVTPRVVARLPVVRRVGLARSLTEVGRTDEARLAAESCQDWIDARATEQINADANLQMLMDMGWVWRRLGEERRARGNWERLLAHHEGKSVHPYNMACFTALVGQTERAIGLIEESVNQYSVTAQRQFFALDYFLDHDPDLNALRDHPDFIAARQALEVKVREREAYLEGLRRERESWETPPPEQAEAIP